MPVVDVVNLDGKKVGQVELADAVFGAKVNPHLLHEASRWYLRGLRAGTHKTKDKSEVSGAGRKLWKQRVLAARASARFVRRSGAWRHGARTEAAGLQLCAAEEDVAGRAALGAIRETGGTEIDRGRCLGARNRTSRKRCV